MSDICPDGAKILNPRIRRGGYWGLKFLRALISNIMIQPLHFMDRLLVGLFFRDLYKFINNQIERFRAGFNKYN